MRQGPLLLFGFSAFYVHSLPARLYNLSPFSFALGLGFKIYENTHRGGAVEECCL